MGMFQEKKRTIEKTSQELADAYEAIAALHEQVAQLAAAVEIMKGGTA